MSSRRLGKLICALMAAASLGGCSSIAVHSQQDEAQPPHMGVKMAVRNTQRHWHQYDYYGQVMFSALDVPLSFVADTILLPVDVYRYQARRAPADYSNQR